MLDAHALVALLVDEPAAREVENLLHGGDTAAVAAINLAEAIDVSIRVHGVTQERAEGDLRSLAASLLRVIECDEPQAVRAGLLRARHYDRRRVPVSIPDCVLVAAAERGDAIASADSGVLAVARAEGLEVVPLPDSTGRRPR